MRRSAHLLILGLLALVVAHPESLHPWQRYDLLAHAPQIERPLHQRRARPWRIVQATLGGAELPEPTPGPASQPSRQLVAGEVRAIEQRSGSRLVWSLSLGAMPYLSARLLGSGADTCRIAVRDSRGEREIFRGAAPTRARFAPAPAEIDLGAWAGRRVDLIFEVHASKGERAPVRWASPAVYWRDSAPAVAPPDGPPSILLIAVDTLRADVVGPRRGGPSLTPEIDRLARESDVYPDAYTAINATNPSFASMFTGRYPKDDGVYDLGTKLPIGEQTLAQALARSGYDTLAVISARHLGDHVSGLGRGFRTVVRADRQFAAETAVQVAMGWLATARRPFFAWVHLFDPHTPHTPPAPFSVGEQPAMASGLGPVRQWLDFRSPGGRDFDEPVLAGNRDLYLGEVAYVDRQIGRLLAYVRSRGLLDSTIVVIVADHGESLGEHGIRYRHAGLYDTTTHVPLILRWPGQRSLRVRRGLVQTLDVYPTLLRAAGLRPPPDQDGVPLDELFASGRNGRSAVFAEHANGLGAMMRTKQSLYFESRGNRRIPDGPYLFDVGQDPAELHNLAGQGRPEEARMRAALERFLANRRAPPGSPRQPLDDEDRADLQALGYF
ncbi:MAG: sulfatase-like hydrolase/transferase [Acidobacteriota bacterium]